MYKINNLLNNLFNKLLKYKIIIILSIIILLFFIYCNTITNNKNNKNNKIYENFNAPTYKTLISKWDNSSGFYSELAFKLNHYLYCKKYNINYKTNSDRWPYKFKNGWTDYFEDIELISNKNNTSNTENLDIDSTHIEVGCCNILENLN